MRLLYVVALFYSMSALCGSLRVASVTPSVKTLPVERPCVYLSLTPPLGHQGKGWTNLPPISVMFTALRCEQLFARSTRSLRRRVIFHSHATSVHRIFFVNLILVFTQKKDTFFMIRTWGKNTKKCFLSTNIRVEKKSRSTF